MKENNVQINLSCKWLLGLPFIKERFIFAVFKEILGMVSAESSGEDGTIAEKR
ncbi:hypothetical protein PaeBR_04910 [Paenibacillus sp. BR2-3]|uniref:hypothetical protein n=1 Tax=Paenibacillus sp. BR2-3 TaxID=3048494 RepID=UPI003977CAA3